MDAWLALGGAVTGLALALTGGGGTLLALPILVHAGGLGVGAATATGLAAVAALSLAGAAPRIRSGEARTGLAWWFAVAGWIGAPLGAWLHGLLPAAMAAAAFSGVVAVVALRMWRGTADPSIHHLPAADAHPACRFAPDGHLALDAPCGRSLAWTGGGVGMLSGLAGVGGGFLAVPALMRLTGMPIRPAVATSLLTVGLIAAGAAAAHVLLGQRIDPRIAAWFIGGGLVGLAAGAAVARHIPAEPLRRGFAIILAIVATASIASIIVEHLP